MGITPFLQDYNSIISELQAICKTAYYIGRRGRLVINRTTLYTLLRGGTVNCATAEKLAAALDMKLESAFDDRTKKAGLSGSSTNKLKLNLSAIFTAAVKKEIMRRNPCKLVRQYRPLIWRCFGRQNEQAKEKPPFRTAKICRLNLLKVAY